MPSATRWSGTRGGSPRSTAPTWRGCSRRAGALELRAHGHAAAGDAALAQARDWLAGRSAAEAASEEHRLRVALVSYIAGRLADAQRQFQLLAAPDRLGRSDSLGAAGAAAVTGGGWEQLDYVGDRG